MPMQRSIQSGLILSDVCNKQGLSLEEHDLRHHNRTLVSSDTVRFANLPNNAQLELVRSTPSDTKAVKKPESPITIALQLSSGERCLSDFCADDTLWDILVHWKTNGKEGILDFVDETGVLRDPVCVYMRREIGGETELKKTSLRSLGLVGGKVILRLLHRPPNVEVKQAFVEALNLRQKQQDTNDAGLVSEGTNLSKSNSLECASTIDAPTNPSMTVQSNVASEAFKNPTDCGHDVNTFFKTDGQNEETVYEEVLPMETECFTPEVDASHSSISSRMMDGVENISDDQTADVGTLVYLDDKDSLLYNLDDISKPVKDELPEQFFEVTLDDVRLLLADMKRQRKELEDGPLLTSAMRESQLLTRLNVYPKGVIRVNFPDRLVLQGRFKATDKVEKIMDFVRSFLVDKKLEFILYTTPPKRILNSEERLFEIPLVPAAVVHFGCETVLDHYLDEDVMEKISSPLAVNRAVLRNNDSQKGTMHKQARLAEDNRVADPTSSEPSTSGLTSHGLPSTARSMPSQQQEQSSKGAIPKWFPVGRK